MIKKKWVMVARSVFFPQDCAYMELQVIFFFIHSFSKIFFIDEIKCNKPPILGSCTILANGVRLKEIH